MKERDGVTSDVGVFFVSYPVPLLNISITEEEDVNITSFVFKVEESDGNGIKFITEVRVICIASTVDPRISPVYPKVRII